MEENTKAVDNTELEETSDDVYMDDIDKPREKVANEEIIKNIPKLVKEVFKVRKKANGDVWEKHGNTYFKAYNKIPNDCKIFGEYIYEKNITVKVVVDKDNKGKSFSDMSLEFYKDNKLILECDSPKQIDDCTEIGIRISNAGLEKVVRAIKLCTRDESTGQPGNEVIYKHSNIGFSADGSEFKCLDVVKSDGTIEKSKYCDKPNSKVKLKIGRDGTLEEFKAGLRELVVPYTNVSLAFSIGVYGILLSMLKRSSKLDTSQINLSINFTVDENVKKTNGIGKTTSTMLALCLYGKPADLLYSASLTDALKRDIILSRSVLPFVVDDFLKNKNYSPNDRKMLCHYLQTDVFDHFNGTTALNAKTGTLDEPVVCPLIMSTEESVLDIFKNYGSENSSGQFDRLIEITAKENEYLESAEHSRKLKAFMNCQYGFIDEFIKYLYSNNIDSNVLDEKINAYIAKYEKQLVEDRSITIVGVVGCCIEFLNGAFDLSMNVDAILNKLIQYINKSNIKYGNIKKIKSAFILRHEKEFDSEILECAYKLYKNRTDDFMQSKEEYLTKIIDKERAINKGVNAVISTIIQKVSMMEERDIQQAYEKYNNQLKVYGASCMYDRKGEEIEKHLEDVDITINTLEDIHDDCKDVAGENLSTQTKDMYQHVLNMGCIDGIDMVDGSDSINSFYNAMKNITGFDEAYDFLMEMLEGISETLSQLDQLVACIKAKYGKFLYEQYENLISQYDLEDPYILNIKKDNGAINVGADIQDHLKKMSISHYDNTLGFIDMIDGREYFCLNNVNVNKKLFSEMIPGGIDDEVLTDRLKNLVEHNLMYTNDAHTTYRFGRSSKMELPRVVNKDVNDDSIEIEYVTSDDKISHRPLFYAFSMQYYDDYIECNELNKTNIDFQEEIQLLSSVETEYKVISREDIMVELEGLEGPAVYVTSQATEYDLYNNKNIIDKTIEVTLEVGKIHPAFRKLKDKINKEIIFGIIEGNHIILTIDK